MKSFATPVFLKTFLRPNMIAGAALVVLLSAGLGWTNRAAAQTAAPLISPKGKTAGEYFKNVTTASLKGVSPSDFIGAMGVMTDAVGYDCSNCHPGAGTDTQDWVTDRSPNKVIARKMIDMVAGINKTFFNGTQQVTCWTCHHGLDQPTTSIALDKLYGEPLDEKRDLVLPQDGEPAAKQIFDDYVQAIGGAQKVNALKSYVATGTSVGYGGVGGTAAFEVYGQAPNSRGVWIHFPEHPDRGVSAWTYNGKTGWISQPRAYIPIYELTGNDLVGAKLDGVIGMPNELRNAFPTWRVGPEETIGDKDVYVVQGTAPGSGVLGTLYFDKKSHLLIRFVRRTPSPVGRITIQQDFDNYKEADGIKFPFHYSFLWLDGRFTADVTNVKVNVPIDPSKFGEPPAAK
jgi:hypothetical protein